LDLKEFEMVEKVMEKNYSAACGFLDAIFSILET
jgi:hypothetical protein